MLGKALVEVYFLGFGFSFLSGLADFRVLIILEGLDCDAEVSAQGG